MENNEEFMKRLWEELANCIHEQELAKYKPKKPDVKAYIAKIKLGMD